MRYSVIPVTHYQQNCSLLICETTQQAAFVDPGGDVEVLLRELERQQVSLQSILLTHGHLDHIGAVAELVERFAVPVIGPHQDDLFWLQSVAQQANYMGFAEPDSFLPDQWLQDGDQVCVGAVTLEVLHCPGHTPGHVVFFQREAQVAWVGDVLFQGSVGRSDFPGGDHQTLIASIRNKLWPLGDQVTFIPGHGPQSTFGYERRYNPFVAD